MHWRFYIIFISCINFDYFLHFLLIAHAYEICGTEFETFLTWLRYSKVLTHIECLSYEMRASVIGRLWSLWPSPSPLSKARIAREGARARAVYPLSAHGFTIGILSTLSFDCAVLCNWMWMNNFRDGFLRWVLFVRVL